MEKGLTRKASSGRQSHLGQRSMPIGRTLRGPAEPGGATPAAFHPPWMSTGSVPLYQKRIDNSSIRYRHDPRDRELWKVGLSLGLFLLVLTLLLWGPQRLVTHSSYKHEALRQRVVRLQAVRDELKLQRGRLQDLRRIAVLAEAMGLRETEPESYGWFALPLGDGEPDTTVARLLRADDSQ